MSFRTYVRGGVRAPQHDSQSVEGIVREAYRDARYRLVRALAVDVLDAVAPRDQCHDWPETRRGRRGRRCGAPRARGGARVAARGKHVVVVVFRFGLPGWPERLPGVPRASHAPILRHRAEPTGAPGEKPVRQIFMVPSFACLQLEDAGTRHARSAIFQTGLTYGDSGLRGCFALTKTSARRTFATRPLAPPRTARVAAEDGTARGGLARLASQGSRRVLASVSQSRGCRV